MKQLKSRLAICIFFCGLYPWAAFGGDDTQHESILQSYKRLSLAVIKTFQRQADYVCSIQNLSRRDSNWKTIREVKTRSWLELLSQIDKVRDKTFNFNDRPTINTAPPDPYLRYDSGIDPTAIPDLKLRRAYEEAIEKNNEKAVRYDFESHLEMLDDQLVGGVVEYVKSAYDKDPGDIKILMDDLNRVDSAEIKLKIRNRLREILPTIK